MFTRVITGPIPLLMLLASLTSLLITSGIRVMQTASYGSLRLGLLEIWTYSPLYGMLATASGCATLLCLRTSTVRNQVLAGITSFVAVLCVVQATTGFMTKGMEAEKQQLIATLSHQPLNSLELIFCQVVFEGGCVPAQQPSP